MSVTIKEALNAIGMSDDLTAMFFQDGAPDDATMLLLRQSFIQFTIAYNIPLVERVCVGYYGVIDTPRSLLGLMPATYNEYVVALLYASAIIFGDAPLSKAFDWLEWHLADNPELDPVEFTKSLECLRGIAIRRSLVA